MRYLRNEMSGKEMHQLERDALDDPFLQDAIATLAPVLLVMGVTVGQVDEIRAYYEFYPIVIVLVADSVCRITGRPMEAKS